MLAGNLANGIPTSGGHFTQALGPMNVLQNGKSRIGSVNKLLRNSLF